MSAKTGSEKIDRLIARAESLDLQVEVVEDNIEVSKYTEKAWRTVSLRIQRPRVEATNALEQVQQAQHVDITWYWTPGVGQTPKMIYAKHFGLYVDHALTAQGLPSAIDALARD